MSSPAISKQYNRFIKLLEKWPVDKTKSRRDLGEHLRKQLQDLINTSVSLSESKAAQLNREIESLERLASNTYGNKYKRIYSSTATGLTANECNQVLSSECLESINKNRGYFNKTKN